MKTLRKYLGKVWVKLVKKASVIRGFSKNYEK